ncbi:hypothetical protein ACFQAT_11380 [Undibacterium arcticum]|uniref:hypothetical protein n=1 Tax=Undibacterium arcticum TaxID=1762892 RepID=UPI00361EE3D6
MSYVDCPVAAATWEWAIMGVFHASALSTVAPLQRTPLDPCVRRDDGAIFWFMDTKHTAGKGVSTGVCNAPPMCD